MGIKYKDPTTGQFKEISVKVADSLPIGTEIDYDGETVPTGWEQVDNPNDYSTTETRIGTYDGKPLYRKKYVLNTYPTSNTDFIDLSSLNIDKLILKGYYKNPTGTFNIPLYDSSTNFSVMFVSQNNMLRGRFSSGVTAAEVVLEYTKTTD